jgi:DNA-binding NarL/FixJ family response regulator
MRVILVGSAAERARLRAEIEGSDLIVADEADDLAAARRSAVRADALVLAAGGSGPSSELLEPLIEPLTPRERDVLSLLAEGLSNKGIAERLNISDQTVKFHVASIYGKLGASNRTDAVRVGFRRGLVAL